MTVGDIETAVPYSDANPEEEMQKTLYSQFRETNWWAHHPHAWKWACAAYWLMLIALAISAKNGGISPETVVGTTLGFLPFLLLLAIIKHFVHDRPLQKYKKEWSLPEDGWSSNVGGILKIYD